jgi:hypothetical protein
MGQKHTAVIETVVEVADSMLEHGGRWDRWLPDISQSVRKATEPVGVVDSTLG